MTRRWATERSISDAIYRAYKLGASKIRRACKKAYAKEIDVYQHEHGQKLTLTTSKYAMMFDVLGADGSSTLTSCMNCDTHGHAKRFEAQLCNRRLAVPELVAHLNTLLSEEFEAEVRKLDLSGAG